MYKRETRLAKIEKAIEEIKESFNWNLLDWWSTKLLNEKLVSKKDCEKGRQETTYPPEYRDIYPELSVVSEKEGSKIPLLACY